MKRAMEEYRGTISRLLDKISLYAQEFVLNDTDLGFGCMFSLSMNEEAKLGVMEQLRVLRAEKVNKEGGTLRALRTFCDGSASCAEYRGV